MRSDGRKSNIGSKNEMNEKMEGWTEYMNVKGEEGNQKQKWKKKHNRR